MIETQDCGYGGVCIYVSNSLKSKRNLTDESDGIELIWIEIQIEKLNILRERPFNLEGGGYGFFLKKYSDSQCY